MHVLVLGAGIVGITTAYELLRDGHSVTVIDRANSAAQETSFANGGQISASHTDPWASLDNFLRALKWIGKQDVPLRLSPGWDRGTLYWYWQFMKNCTAGSFRKNTERMLRIALYSRARYAQIRSEFNVDFDLETRGILHVFRNPNVYGRSLEQARYVESLGCRRQPVDVERCVEIEPALDAVREDLIGGVYCPQDESGDAHRFACGLYEQCVTNGGVFRFGETVQSIQRVQSTVTTVCTDRCDHTADAVVIALGSYSPHFLRSLGVSLPVCPAKGYSVTLPVDEGDCAPRVSLIDDENKLVYSRLGQRLRVAGMAELVGFDLGIDPARAALLTRRAFELFPRIQVACDPEFSPEYWCGLRPQTPDSVPVFGAAGAENLFLNTGHGTLGWTMAAGSARITADLIKGAVPEVSMTGLTLERFGR